MTTLAVLCGGGHHVAELYTHSWTSEGVGVVQPGSNMERVRSTDESLAQMCTNYLFKQKFFQNGLASSSCRP